jgi:hypothetical protein
MSLARELFNYENLNYLRPFTGFDLLPQPEGGKLKSLFD